MYRSASPAASARSPLFGLLLSLLVAPLAAAEDPISFTQDIRPLLSDSCFACHGPDEQRRQAGLRLDQAGAARASGAVAPGSLEDSEMWARITSDDPDVMMPPPEFGKRLSPEQRELIRRWIESGAEYQEHWSFVAPRKAPLPEGPVAHPIDAFVQQRLRQAGLQPSPWADRRTLIRRVTLDLTGLPPTPAEIEAFLADESAGAYEKLIDQLMSRSAYGEQMARYWLDLARYADTHGLHLDNERSMWPYRDWVVRAFQQNLPFDDFTRWQLAGDLLPDPTADQRIASGFNRCNVSTSEGGSIAEEWIFRYAVDRTATTAEVWLGLTAGCAVCHDHKFDPLSTREFYSMYAFFHSAADPAMDGNKNDTPPVWKIYDAADRAEIEQLDARLAEIEGRIDAALAALPYDDPALADPPPEPEITEQVWFEDAFPTGAKVNSSGAPLQLIQQEEGPVFSGELALRRSAEGLEQDYYNSGAEAFTVPENAKVFVYCYLDPEHPPQAVMIQFHSDTWKHRAVWGDESKIPFGKAKTSEKVLMGELPRAGEWVRLEVDAAKMGLKAGVRVTGYAFTQFDGVVGWDRLGVESRVDKARDPGWSFDVWKRRKAGKRNNELPEGLRQLVRAKQADAWSDEETKTIFGWWLRNAYSGAREALAEAESQRAALLADKAKIEKDAPVTLVMADLPQPRESFVMLRGAYDQPGEQVRRNVPAFLPSLGERPEGRDYNRLDLAEWLVSGRHPLTARVAVNRFWQQFFGTGIVATSGDFGSQGEPPSHPELLDWLAVDFVESGWDVQRLVKLILTSRAYGQSSQASEELLRADPENRLLARAPRVRLDAEVLRDQALFVSGLLVQRVGGKPVKPYQPPQIWEPVGFGNSNTRYYQQDTGDALYRRSLYTFLKRTAPPPYMSTFDAPNREQSCTRRQRSNTPLQALQLMNDVQHVEAARHFAERMLDRTQDNMEQRIAWAWEAVTARRPDEQELAVARRLLEENLLRYRQDEEAAQALVSYGDSPRSATHPPAELAAYTMLANLLLNLDECLNKN